jgi:hypothetical protein
MLRKSVHDWQRLHHHPRPLLSAAWRFVGPSHVGHRENHGRPFLADRGNRDCISVRLAEHDWQARFGQWCLIEEQPCLRTTQNRDNDRRVEIDNPGAEAEFVFCVDREVLLFQSADAGAEVSFGQLMGDDVD